MIPNIEFGIIENNFEREIKLVTLNLNSNSQYFAISNQLAKQQYRQSFVEEVLFQPKNEVVAIPKIELKWDWVSDVYVYIKSDAVILFWQCCHVRTRQTSEN